MRAVHGSCLTGRAGLDGLEEGGEEDAGAGVVQVSQLVVGVEVTAWRGVTGGAARRLIGNIRMESYEVAPDVSLHTTAARLGLVQGVAVVVGGLTVRTLVPRPTGGEQEAGVRLERPPWVGAGDQQTVGAGKSLLGFRREGLSQDDTLLSSPFPGNRLRSKV